MHGYFVDGMIYASLARNLAEGYGSFWDMYLSDGLFSHFREHPPLGIYIQSLFYQFFGDSELIDKFYGFFIGFGILGLIAMIHRRLHGYISGSWFPLLAFLLFPLTTYVLSYNWLEHILTLAIMASSLAVIVALTGKHGTVVIGSLVAGALIFTGIMIKGPTALYPLAIPFFAWVFLANVRLKRAMVTLAVMLLGLGLCIGIFVLSSEPAMAFFDEYLRDQVFGSLRGENSVHSRTKLLESLLTEELISPLVVFGFLMWMSKTSWLELRTDGRFWFFLGIAFSGSLPLIFSPKQNDYYLFISLPFYALAIAALFDPLRQTLEAKVVGGKRLVIASVILLLLTPAVMLSKQGEYRKDKAYHQSFTETPIELPDRVKISSCPQQEILEDWNLIANFQRYYSASLTQQAGHDYLLTTRKDMDRCVEDKAYTLLSRDDTSYLLYHRQMPGAKHE